MGHIAIIGGGAIGMAFSIVFARSGHAVRVAEIDPSRRSELPDEIRERLVEMAEFALIDETPDDIISRITVVESPIDAVPQAFLVQECGPERVETKRPLFAELDSLAEPEAIIASASSAIPVSKVAETLSGRARCLVTHPANPPYLLPMLELVPAPFTDPAITQRAAAFYTSCGMVPSLIHREIKGFVYNRLQGALLREAYCLVRDGVADVADIDQMVRDGLGLRWSVVGPFETVDLNTRGGVAAHAERMGPAYERMGAERGQHDPWTPDLVAKVTEQLRAAIPSNDWEERIRWRDRSLMALIEQRRKLKS